MNNLEYELIKKLLKERHLEHLDCAYLKKISYEFALNVLDMEEWKEEKLQLLSTPTIWNENTNEIKEVLSLPYWEEEKFKYLLTPSIWNKKSSEIKEILSLPYWEEEKFKPLLTSSVWPLNAQHITEVIELFKSLNIEDYLNSAVLYKSLKQIKALVLYCYDNRISLIVKGKLNPIFSYSPKALKKAYGIDLKLLVKEYEMVL